jgi:hypothetical protein
VTAPIAPTDVELDKLFTHLVEALARCTPHAGMIARNIAREKIRELV